MNKIKTLAYTIAITSAFLAGCKTKEIRPQEKNLESLSKKYESNKGSRPEWQLEYSDPCKNLTSESWFDCRINDPNTSPFYSEFLKFVKDK